MAHVVAYSQNVKRNMNLIHHANTHTADDSCTRPGPSEYASRLANSQSLASCALPHSTKPLLHVDLSLCVSSFVCVCVCVCKCASTFDWRHAAAGSNYKDMKQIVEDCCFMQHWETHMRVNIQKSYDKLDCLCFKENCHLSSLTPSTKQTGGSAATTINDPGKEDIIKNTHFFTLKTHYSFSVT